MLTIRKMRTNLPIEEDALYLSLGSNMGDREGNIRQALSRLEQKWGIPCEACSSLIETQPWGRWKERPTPFLNAVARFRIPKPSDQSEDALAAKALALLDACKEVERALGREEILEFDQDGERIYHPRPIDIDILLWGHADIDLPTLKIPHPRMWERDFVTRPLEELSGH